MALSVANKRLDGHVLPTVLAVSMVILTGLAGLLLLYEQETLLFARDSRLRQSRADVASAYSLYRLHPGHTQLLSTDGYRLFDSVPASKVHVTVRPWGLYELVRVSTADSLVRTARLFGAEPDHRHTLHYRDDRRGVTLAGNTNLHGILFLPQNGLTYGRINSDFFSGEQVLPSSIRLSGTTLPAPDPAAERTVARLFSAAPAARSQMLPDSLFRSFVRDSTDVFRLGSAEIGDCRLLGNVILYGDELRIDSTCRLEHTIVCARKITVGRGARITAQLFARDTILVQPRAVLGSGSGIYAEKYAGLDEGVVVNGYVIVRDTVPRRPKSACYRQARTARVRGLVRVDGVAQVQGLVTGSLMLGEAAWFSPQGRYENTLYDLTLLENPETAHPLWSTAAKRRKEAAWVF